MTDRRSWPANARVAAEELRGAVEGVEFVAGRSMQGTAPLIDICAAPGGARDRQVLFGQTLDVLEIHEGWAFVRADRDRYVGYARADDLAEGPATTHRVTSPATHVYSRPDMKSPDRMTLSHGSELTVLSEGEGFAETPTGFVPLQHFSAVEAIETNLLGVARLFLGTPYLWGGNSIWGIDCSGLVQAACLGCGIACPGDSDQQAQALGVAVDDEPKPQDLLFWDGHVAFVDEGDSLLHANAHHMMVVSEPLQPALERIAASAGPIRAHRRVELP